jgi:hypothetical protein
MVVVLITATTTNRLCEVEGGVAIRDQIVSGRFGWSVLLTLGHHMRHHGALVKRLRR